MLFADRGDNRQLYEALSGYLFEDLLYEYKDRIKSIIELGECGFMSTRSHSTNWHFALSRRLKHIYYSIDYIGLNEVERFEKLVSLLPDILDNGRFNSVDLPIEYRILRENISFVSSDYLKQIDAQTARILREMLPRKVKFILSEADYNEKLKALERD